MTPELRRGIAALLAGVVASLVALLVSTTLRARSCAAIGGEWMEGVRRCALLAGMTEPSPWRSSLAGAVAGIVTLLVLWRTFTWFADRRVRGGR